MEELPINLELTACSLFSSSRRFKQAVFGFRFRSTIGKQKTTFSIESITKLESNLTLTSYLRFKVRDNVNCLVENVQFGLRLVALHVNDHHAA